jgi:hypothetical protein
MTACQNASFWTQERQFSMRRKRYQSGSVIPRTHGRKKVWVAQWWENGHRRSKVHGPFSSMSKARPKPG